MKHAFYLGFVCDPRIVDEPLQVIYCIEGCPDMADGCNHSTWFVPGTGTCD